MFINTLSFLPTNGQTIVWDYISIAFIVILIIAVIVNAVKGFATSLISLVAGLGSIVLAVLLATPVGNLLYQTGLGPSIQGGIDGWVSSSLGSLADMALTEENLAQAFSQLNIPEILAKPLTEMIANANLDTASVAEAISTSLANYACIAISFIVLWIVFLVVFSLLGKLVKGINKIPLVGVLNHILGGVFGLAIGLLVCFLACYIIQLIGSMNGDLNETLSEMMHLTDEGAWSISKALYEINFIPKIIEALL